MENRVALAVVAVLYATVAVVLASALAPVFVLATVLFDPAAVCFVVGLVVLVTAVSELTPAEPSIAVFVLVAGGVVPALVVGQYDDVVRHVAGNVTRLERKVVVTWLTITVVALVGLPFVARRLAWRTLDAATTTTGSLSDVVPARYASQVPARLDVRELDVATPAVYAVDDGRRAIVYLTTGARDALDERTRDAVLAREVARGVERTAVAPFWPCALAAASRRLLDLLLATGDVAGVGDQSSRPHPLAALAKTAFACVVVAFGYYIPASLVASTQGSNPGVLAAVLGVRTVGLTVGTARVARVLARRTSRPSVRTPDEGGAVLADDATALKDAIRTLQASQDPPREDQDVQTYRHSISASGQVRRIERRVPAAFDPLAHCPTTMVPVQDRREALDEVADRLDETYASDTTDAVPANARS